MKVLATLALAVFGTVAVSSAASFTISSNGTATDANESNSTGGPTLAIAKHPGWVNPLAGSEWVSYGTTGDPNAPGYFMPANSTIVSFFDMVILDYLPTIASITVRADDSTSLYINGSLVFSEATQAGNTYTTCSDFPVGCLETTEVTADITSFLNAGANTFRFDVAQRASISFGLNYRGTIETPEPNNDVPEPATYAMIGGALIGLNLYRRRSSR
jgi:hypothetical protein